MERLSTVLWTERELLETLVYRLEVQRGMLARGRDTWIARAAREVEDVLEQLRAHGIGRAVVADEVAERLGLSPSPSLIDLAEASDEPWRSILIDHRTTMLELTESAVHLAGENRELLSTALRMTQETLRATQENDAAGYGADGAARTDTAQAPRLLDRSL